MAYSTFKLENAASVYDIDVYCKTLKVVKVKTSRWLLCDFDGSVVFSARSETDILNRAGKLEVRRSRGNLNGFRFGSKIDSKTVAFYAGQVWGDLFKLSNIRFKDNHYWMGVVENVETGAVSEEIRLDYFINAQRIPHNVESEMTVNMAKLAGARQ